MDVCLFFLIKLRNLGQAVETVKSVWCQGRILWDSPDFSHNGGSMIAPAPITVTHFQCKRIKPVTKRHMSADSFFLLRIFPKSPIQQFPLLSYFLESCTNLHSCKRSLKMQFCTWTHHNISRVIALISHASKVMPKIL